NSDSEMTRRFKEVAWDDRSLVFLAQQLKKGRRFTLEEPGKSNRPRWRTKTFQVSARIEESVEERTIRFQQSLSAGAKLRQMIEGHDRHAFRGMSGIRSEKVVESTHAMRQLRSRQDPATAKATQTVGFCQAARDNKIFA